jgi:hypothetical protein
VYFDIAKEFAEEFFKHLEPEKMVRKLFIACILNVMCIIADDQVPVVDHVKSMIQTHVTDKDRAKEFYAKIVVFDLEKWPMSEPYPGEINISKLIKGAVSELDEIASTRESNRIDNKMYLNYFTEKFKYSIDVEIYKDVTTAQGMAFNYFASMPITPKVLINPEGLEDWLAVSYNKNACMYVYRNMIILVNRSPKKDYEGDVNEPTSPSLVELEGLMGKLHQKLTRQAEKGQDEPPE